MKTDKIIPLFIAAESYKTTASSNPNYVSKAGTLIPGEAYKLEVDGRFRYGQKNAQGENRFVVFHDEERKPYPHRFIETAVLSTLSHTGEAGADKVLALFGLPAGTASSVTDNVKCYVGDYLHNF